MRFGLMFVLLLLPLMAGQASQFSLQSQSASGAFPDELAGAWGSAEQCRVLRSGEPEHPGRATYRISAEWISQGLIHCNVSWFGAEQQIEDKRFRALAQCGEDDLREYRLSLLLRPEGLSIRWSLDYVTPVLQRCQ